MKMGAEVCGGVERGWERGGVIHDQLATFIDVWSRRVNG